MATIRIHEDQENRVPELRQKQGTMAVQQKRSVLGFIENDKQRTNVVQAKGKQPLGLLNAKVGTKKAENENDCFKENRKNLVNPIVPVAQFEAFKVYEDFSYEERMARIEEKLKSKIKETSIQVYKGTAEDRFYTKTEVAELERKKRAEEEARGIFKPKKELIESPVPSPMSIEKSFDNSLQLAEHVLKCSKSTKDIFFEMEEYRVDIYRYLREHEVCYIFIHRQVHF